MKKFTCVLVIFTVLFLLCGCKQSNNSESTAPAVTVNMPTDNTVGGYLNSDNGSTDGKTISGDSVTVIQGTENQESGYIASKNSKIFHKVGCTWAKNIKAKNKIHSETREEMTAKGLKPCTQCNP